MHITSEVPAPVLRRDETDPRHIGYLYVAGYSSAFSCRTDSTYRTSGSLYACCPLPPQSCAWPTGCSGNNILGTVESANLPAITSPCATGTPCISYTLLQSINDLVPIIHYDCFPSVVNGISFNGVTFYRTPTAGSAASLPTISSTSPVSNPIASGTATSPSRGIPSTSSANPSITLGASGSSSSPSTTIAPNSDEDSSLGVNTIVGIVFGALGLVVAIVTAWFSWRMWKEKKRKNRLETSQT